MNMHNAIMEILEEAKDSCDPHTLRDFVEEILSLTQDRMITVQDCTKYILLAKDAVCHQMAAAVASSAIIERIQ
jgi:type IV secretory pathway TrbF-like protein